MRKLLLTALVVPALFAQSNLTLVRPCRVVDTRDQTTFPADNGGTLAASTTRTFNIGGKCGVPTSATGYYLKITFFPMAPASWIEFWAAGQPPSGSQDIRFVPGGIAEQTIPVQAGTNGNVSAYSNVVADVLIDIAGYFKSAQTPPPSSPIYSSQLADFVPLLASGTLTMNPSASPTLPVVVRTCSGAVYRGVAPAAATVNSAGLNDRAYGYIDNTGALIIGTSIATVNCTGCTALLGVTAFPTDSINLFTWTITAGAFDPAGYTNLRSFLH